jgi:hypothetical protein
LVLFNQSMDRYKFSLLSDISDNLRSDMLILGSGV